MWTLFWDMHSGGGLAEPPYSKIYIEAGEEDAIQIFIDRFGHDPDHVTCSCCGSDYSVDEFETFEQASGYHRNCADGENGYIEEWHGKYGEYLTVEEYEKQDDVLIIRSAEIF